jgi:TolA-binding protein
VRLMDGAVTVEVQPLRPGERFRIITGDAEVEVRGTIFEVTVAEDRLVAVRVFRGNVEVRPVGAPRVVLAAGQRWDAARTIAQAPAAAAAAKCPGGDGTRAAVPAELLSSLVPPAEVPPVSVPVAWSGPDPSSRPLAAREVRSAGIATAVPTVETNPGSGAGVTTPTPAESAFDEGWAALRSGDDRAAVDAFARAETAAGADALAEDASFWHAVALGRADREAEAGRVLVGFLDRFPWSPRAGEASAMLGWILLDAGDVEGAAARFRIAAGDTVPAVRESARRGLEAVESARGSR